MESLPKDDHPTTEGEILEKLQELFAKEPPNMDPGTLNKWQQIGPFTFDTCNEIDQQEITDLILKKKYKFAERQDKNNYYIGTINVGSNKR